MWLRIVVIRNFRGIENLTINFNERANVIVGPNAIGKTTLLEAIRLAKAALAPRTPDETQQVFTSLGAIQPQNPTRFNYAGLAGDAARALEIKATFALAQEEVQSLDGLVTQLATTMIRAGMGPVAQGPLALVQYLSSPAGQQALGGFERQINTELPSIKAASSINLNLTIDAGGTTIRGERQLEQLIFSVLEAGLPAHQTLFSYFPADRALLAGETPIQIGGPDIQLQLQSHNANPQLKFARLKPTIVNNFLLSEATRTKLQHNFTNIFTQILRDRSLVDISVNDLGFVSIRIKENSTARTFDIDGMSSGEKGLILTFLLISHTVSPNGIIMIDEPELHVNPAVCKILLPILIDEYLSPNNIQAIICSHSPEVLGTAFDSDKCALFHLQSPTVISEILPEDRREVFDALHRLGVSASDALFSAGNIFVEGEHDIEILEAGFGEIVTRYNLTPLGGHGTVEREVTTLQEAERKGEIDTLKCFIFDLDNAPSSLQSTRLVKVLQWRRRCIENYLIDDKSIYDLLSDGGNIFK